MLSWLPGLHPLPVCPRHLCLLGLFFPVWFSPPTLNPDSVHCHTILTKLLIDKPWPSVQFSSVQWFSHVQPFVTQTRCWIAALQASLSIMNSQSLLKLMSIELVMPYNLLTLCRPLLLPPSIFPSIRVFSSESVLCIRWTKDWSFSFSISPSSELQDWFPLGWTGWISLQSKGLSRVFSNTTVQKHQHYDRKW